MSLIYGPNYCRIGTISWNHPPSFRQLRSRISLSFLCVYYVGFEIFPCAYILYYQRKLPPRVGRRRKYVLRPFTILCFAGGLGLGMWACTVCVIHSRMESSHASAHARVTAMLFIEDFVTADGYMQASNFSSLQAPGSSVPACTSVRRSWGSRGWHGCERNSEY